MNLESRAKNRKAEEVVRAWAVKASKCGEHGGEVNVTSPSHLHRGFLPTLRQRQVILCLGFVLGFPGQAKVQLKGS